MTRTKQQQKTKANIILTLLLAGLLCFSTFFATACNKETETTTTKPNYTYVEEDDAIIKNSDFAYGTVGTKLENFPKKSITGWSRSTRNSLTSDADSGVVDVTEAGWDEVLDNLYSESGILNYVKTIYDFDDADVTAAIREEKGDSSYKVTANDKKEYIVRTYYKLSQADGGRFLNPGVPNGVDDNKVYMLNNYASNEVGFGAAQGLKSTSAITLEKGTYGKISVWVKTANMDGITDEVGANIVIESTIDGSEQADFGIFNIVDTEWTQYTIYLKADDVYNCKFNLVLGLGYDYATEGTAYFDNVSFEELTADEYANEIGSKTNANTTLFTLTNSDDDAIKVLSSDITADKYVLYDMDFGDYLNSLSTYVSSVPFNSNFADSNYYDYTKSNTDGISGKPFASSSASVTSAGASDFENAPYGISTGIKATLNKASYTVKFDNSGANFEVPSEEYVYVSFYVKNNLSKIGSTNFSVNVIDIYSSDVFSSRNSIVTLSEVGDDWFNCSILIKNNFDATKFTSPRFFSLEIVLGPSNVKLDDAIDFATGSVVISDPVITTGSINKYVDEENEIKTDNYDVYSFLSSSVAGSTSLYAGGSDYVADEDDSTIYSLTVSPSDMGTIVTKPANAKDYTGVIPNHFYMKEEVEGQTLEKEINTKETAGIINTQYLSNYDSSTYGDLSSIFSSVSDPVQPLMIYNPTADSYGFIGAKKTISASAFAKVSVDVKVVGDAVAYIYLVNTANADKSILTFDEFTVNTNEFNSVSGTKIEQKELFFTVDSSMLADSANGWLTVEFYVATGATAKDIRLELWNGSRDGVNTSTGHVFFDNVSVSTSGAFTEATDWSSAFIKDSFFNSLGLSSSSFDELYMYKRELTSQEKEYNSKVSASEKISYLSNYVWAKNDTMIYAVYNTIDPVAIEVPEIVEDSKTSGCNKTETDANWWLTFSSIVLAVVLLFAIIMLFVKNIRRRMKANASDAKSHYKVVSRTSAKNKKAKVEKKVIVEEVDETTPTETQTEEVNEEEQTLDEYVYGDVQNFGDDDKKDN